MRVTILEERLSDQDPETERLYVQEKGDTITVPDALGTKWCGLGWAEDVDGKVKTGERRVEGAHIVAPDKASHKAVDTNGGRDG
jgi:hypothetical protein